jgi:hypothetical protein
LPTEIGAQICSQSSLYTFFIDQKAVTEPSLWISKTTLENLAHSVPDVAPVPEADITLFESFSLFIGKWRNVSLSAPLMSYSVLARRKHKDYTFLQAIPGLACSR